MRKRTLKELGFEVGTPENYIGAFAPKGTSAEVLLKLNEAILNATKEPEVKQKLAKIGLAATYKNAKELEQLVDNFGKFCAEIAPVVVYDERGCLLEIYHVSSTRLRD